jgi:ATP-dependent RNA helicase RhlE
MNHTHYMYKRRHNGRQFTSGNGRRKSDSHSFRDKKSNNRSLLDPDLLIKEARDLKENNYIASRSFNQMPINDHLKAALDNKGYVYPTEIQDKTIEKLIEGHNLLGIAQSGTGKTGAFLIPIIHNMIRDASSMKTLVVVPTRELAIQVEQEFRSLTKGLSLFSACFIGGINISRDLNKLRRKVHLITGTPGRLLDLEKRKVLNLRSFNILILDEFDRMLDMGFVDDVMDIINSMLNRKQTLLFSATEDKSQQSLISRLLYNPEQVKVSSRGTSGCYIEQNILRVKNNEEKFSILLDMIQQEDFEKVLVFAETKRLVDTVYRKLKKSGIRVDQIHGDKSQNRRQTALNDFKNGKIQVLVATDVAARGIDVNDITHVINYQLPKTIENYIHRIGRTGRAGKSGKAFSFVN